MNEEESFIDKGGIAGYLNRNYKDKTIGKEITPHVRSGLQILGDSYQDAMWKARRGMLGPHSFIGAHAIDTIGKIIPDIPLDKAISHGLHEGLGIDKPLADVGGVGGEVLLTRKALKSIPKNVVSTTVTPYTKGLNPVSKKKLIKITEEAFSSENSLFKNRRIPKYSSGAVVQTESGTLYRPTPGTMTSTFMSVKDPLGQGELFEDEQANFPRRNLEGKGEDLTEPTLIPTKLNKGGYSVSDLQGSGPFDITGQGEFREFREFAAAMQDPRFNDNDFYTFQKVLSEAMLKKFPEMTKQELALKQHHFNPIKQGARLINGLSPEERAKAVVFLAENGVLAGNTPYQNYPIPDKIHIKVHDFINNRVGKQLEILYDKINLEELNTFESRKTYIRKYMRVIRQSEEFIYGQLQELAARKQLESRRATGWEPWIGDALKGLPPEELVEVLNTLPGWPEYINEATLERVSTGYRRLLDTAKGKKPRRVRSRRSKFESDLKRYANQEGIYEDSAQLNMWSNLLEDIFGIDREE